MKTNTNNIKIAYILSVYYKPSYLDIKDTFSSFNAITYNNEDLLKLINKYTDNATLLHDGTYSCDWKFEQSDNKPLIVKDFYFKITHKLDS